MYQGKYDAMYQGYMMTMYQGFYNFVSFINNDVAGLYNDVSGGQFITFYNDLF